MNNLFTFKGFDSVNNQSRVSRKYVCYINVYIERINNRRNVRFETSLYECHPLFKIFYGLKGDRRYQRFTMCFMSGIQISMHAALFLDQFQNNTL